MTDQLEFLRRASPNEQRTISREDLGFYNAVIVGAVYDLGKGHDVQSHKTFYHPLKRCVERHPFLCVTVADRHTDKAFYQRGPTINLDDHIIIEDQPVPSSDIIEGMNGVFAAHLDKPFHHDVPCWKIIVLPLQQEGQCFVAFAYSHSICDGGSGFAFHRTFLKACNEASPANTPSIVDTPKTPFPAPFDTPERLPISWSFLLAPLLSTILPVFLVDMLGLRTGAVEVGESTWTGAPATYDPSNFGSKVQTHEIEASVLANAVSAARKHDARLTGVFQELIARAAARHLPAHAARGKTELIPQTAVNMRPSIGMSKDEMGEYVSGCYTVHPLITHSVEEQRQGGFNLTDDQWASAAKSTKELAEATTRLHDQAIGLLRYAPSIRKWTQEKIGKRRDCSFEVSNIGIIDGENDEGRARIIKTAFSQPGTVFSDPFSFNFSSVKGGSLVFTVTWQGGALGLGSEEEEERFMSAVCKSFKDDFAALE